MRCRHGLRVPSRWQGPCMDHRKLRIVTPSDRDMRAVERRTAALAERSRNLEVWVTAVTWLLLFAIVMSWRHGTPLVATTAATAGAFGAFGVIRLLHRHR